MFIFRWSWNVRNHRVSSLHLPDKDRQVLAMRLHNDEPPDDADLDTFCIMGWVFSLHLPRKDGQILGVSPHNDEPPMTPTCGRSSVFFAFCTNTNPLKMRSRPHPTARKVNPQ